MNEWLARKNDCLLIILCHRKLDGEGWYWLTLFSSAKEAVEANRMLVFSSSSAATALPVADHEIMKQQNLKFDERDTLPVIFYSMSPWSLSLGLFFFFSFHQVAPVTRIKDQGLVRELVRARDRDRKEREILF